MDDDAHRAADFTRSQRHAVGGNDDVVLAQWRVVLREGRRGGGGEQDGQETVVHDVIPPASEQRMAGACRSRTNGRHALADGRWRHPHRRDRAAPPQGSSLRRRETVPWPIPGPRQERPAPAGLLARGSSLDARPSRIDDPVAASSREASASRSPLTVAGTAAVLDGHPSAPHSRLSPVRGTGAIIGQPDFSRLRRAPYA